MTCSTTPIKATEPPHQPEQRRLFVESLTGHTADPEALADDLESAWLFPVWKEWQTGAGKSSPKGMKVRGFREPRDELQAVADKLRAVLPDLCAAHWHALWILAPETQDTASLRTCHLAQLEEANRFVCGTHTEMERALALIEQAARALDKRTRTGPPSWCATPAAQVASGLRKQLEKRGIACRNKATEPYRCAAGWVWPYLDLTGDPASHLRNELRRNAPTIPPAPALSAWLSSAAT